MPYKKYPPLGKEIKTISIKDRKSLVGVERFGQPFAPGSSFQSYLQSLPACGVTFELLEFCRRMKEARQKEKPIILGMGAHTVKVGINPVIIDLMERGWVSAIAVNGAFLIHDFEIALAGKTSEDVSATLFEGRYGNTEETGLFLNIALKEGLDAGYGGGESVGYYLIQAEFPFNKYSVLYHAYKLNIPVTLHPAIGTDFIHYHPNFDGAVLGALAEKDFLLFSSLVSSLSGGGIYMNIGSAVILPEVFLKAIAFCTAQDIEIKEIYTAVFDFIRHYRPAENVVKRPVLNGGKGYYFVGPHEILIPLIAAILLTP